MKKYTLLFVAFFFTACLLLSCGNTGRYEDGYEDGYNDGYNTGWNDGFDDGYDAALFWDEHEASNDQCSDGYDAGYEDGYNEGEFGGYYAGATYTCLYFGDVDLAFQSAKNGFAWDTFIDAYDEYIANIYDTDDTRSSLFWAFVSAMESNDATSEEIMLLIDAFGSDLFIRNGIDLNPS